MERHAYPRNVVPLKNLLSVLVLYKTCSLHDIHYSFCVKQQSLTHSIELMFLCKVYCLFTICQFNIECRQENVWKFLWYSLKPFQVLRSPPLVVNTSQSFLHSWLITGVVTRLTRRVSLGEQELLTFSEHLSSSPVFSGVRVTRSLVLCVCFVDRCLSFCTFSFGHCVVCSSSICGFWLPLWIFKLFTRTILVIP